MRRPLAPLLLCGVALAQDLIENNAFMEVQPGNFACLNCSVAGDATRIKLEASSLSARYRFKRGGSAALRFTGGEVMLNRQPLSPRCQTLKLKPGHLLGFNKTRGLSLEMPGQCREHNGSTPGPHAALRPWYRAVCSTRSAISTTPLT